MIKNLPLVSIILPTYNSNKNRLSLSINSVLSQSYRNFELIIINDASTNDSEKTILQYQSQDKRIIYHKNEKNIKLTNTLNKGIELSQGEYIARIDDDDIWCDQDKLKTQIDFMEENKDYGLCGTSVITIDEQGKTLQYIDVPSDNFLIQKKLIIDSQFAHSSVVIRRSILDKIGLYNPERNFVEDYELWLRIGTVSKLYNFSEYMLKYRINSQGVSKKNRLKQKYMSLSLSLQYTYFKYYPNAFLSVILKTGALILPDYLLHKAIKIYYKIIK